MPGDLTTLVVTAGSPSSRDGWGDRLSGPSSPSTAVAGPWRHIATSVMLRATVVEGNRARCVPDAAAGGGPLPGNRGESCAHRQRGRSEHGDARPAEHRLQAGAVRAWPGAGT